MKLTKRDDVDVSGDVITYDSAQEPNPRFKHEDAVSGGYTELTGIKNWGDYGRRAIPFYKTFRNELIGNLTDWATLSDADKKILIRHYLWPATEAAANLDLLYTQQERDDYQEELIDQLRNWCDCVIIQSNIANSKKYFELQVDDAGTLTTVEITTDQAL